MLIIPWVVVQELDRMKAGKLLKYAQHKAVPAVRFINDSLKSHIRESLEGDKASTLSEYLRVFSFLWFPGSKREPGSQQAVRTGTESPRLLGGSRTAVRFHDSVIWGREIQRRKQMKSGSLHPAPTLLNCHASHTSPCPSPTLGSLDERPRKN